VDTVLSGLHASEPEQLGFGPALEIRAFLLERAEGNLLLYRSAALKRQAEVIDDLGGISRQYLNHWHEAAPTCDWVAETFGAPLLCHADDEAKVSEACNVSETFAERHIVGDDFEVIPTPGHTPGATIFRWETGEHRCLFTGDTLFFPSGEWVAAVLESSDRERYIESLELIRGLDFDVVVPSITGAGRPYHAVVERSEAARRIDGILERLQRRRPLIGAAARRHGRMGAASCVLSPLPTEGWARSQS
jgi:hypothetical protein